MTNQIKVIENFIDKEDAKILIGEMDNPSSINPYPDFYSNRNGGTALPYNDVTVSMLQKYGEKVCKTISSLYNLEEEVYITKGYSSHWTAGTEGGPHIDDQEKEPFIEYSAVIYLNEYPDFEGGKIYFPEKNFEFYPIKYSAVFFPQKDKSYIHGISKVTSGHRYTFLFHACRDKQFADPDILKGKYDS